MSLNLSVDRRLIRSERASTRYILARIAAPASLSDFAELPVNVAFVLDRSASMYGDKIELARDAVLSAIRSLREGDRFAVVACDHEVDLIVPLTPATTTAVLAAEGAVRRVTARGLSDLAGGWLAGCEQVAGALDEHAVGCCLLLSDGIANFGLTDHREIIGHALALAARGVVTTTFAVGRDCDERLLAALAEAGAGAAYYVESPAQIPDFVATEVREAREIVARDVRLLVEAPAGVRVRVLNDLWAKPDRTRLNIAIGALVSEQVLDVVIRVIFPPGPHGAKQLVAVALSDRDEVLAGAADKVTFTYSSAEENDAQARLPGVDKAVATMSGASIRLADFGFNRFARHADVQGALSEATRRFAGYAGDDAEVLAILRELDSTDEIYAGVLGPKLAKVRFALAHSPFDVATSATRPGVAMPAAMSGQGELSRAKLSQLVPSNTTSPLLERSEGTP